MFVMFTVHNQELYMTDFYLFIFTKFSSTYAVAFQISVSQTAFGPRTERQGHDSAKTIFQHLGARAKEILSQVSDSFAPLRWHQTNLRTPEQSICCD